MRALATSFYAMMLSGFAGGMVAQVLAEMTLAGEEYILVFMLLPLLTIVATAVFLIAQYRPNARAAVDTVGRWMLGIYVLAASALVGFQIYVFGGDVTKLGFAWPILAGLILPGLVMMIVHWAFVRWRVGKRPAIYGRGGVAA